MTGRAEEPVTGSRRSIVSAGDSVTSADRVGGDGSEGTMYSISGAGFVAFAAFA